MKASTQNYLKLAIIVTLGVSYFILHTALTMILEPTTVGAIFLIVAFGFIAKGLEYYFTIPSDSKAPWMTAGGFRIGGYAIPMILYFFASRMDALGLGRQLFQTAVCILVILIFGNIKKIAEFIIEEYEDDDDDDD